MKIFFSTLLVILSSSFLLDVRNVFAEPNDRSVVEATELVEILYSKKDYEELVKLAGTLAASSLRDWPIDYTRMEEIEAAFVSHWLKNNNYSSIETSLAKSWMKHYSRAEIQEYLHFFKSPAGKKFRSNSGKVQNDLLHVLLKTLRPNPKELQKIVLPFLDVSDKKRKEIERDIGLEDNK